MNTIKMFAALTILSGLVANPVKAQTEFVTSAELPINSATDYTSIYIEDLNADGLEDILLARPYGFEQYLANGEGDFSVSSVNNSDRRYARYNALGDINADGFSDFLLGQVVFFGTSNGLTTGVELTGTIANSTNPCYRPVLFDLNDDSLLDIVCEYRPDEGLGTTFTGYGYRAFLNKGNARFDFESFEGNRVFAGTRQLGLVKGDINNDGKEDIVVLMEVFEGNIANSSAARSHQILATFLGGDSEMTLHSEISGAVFLRQPLQSTQISGAELRDVDNDRDLDLVLLVVRTDSDDVRHYLSPMIATFPGDGTGTFNSDFIETTLTYDASPTSMNLADINADGILDAVLSFSNRAFIDEQLGITVRYGLGDGSFDDGQTITDQVRNARVTAVGDLNADGRIDIVSATGWSPGKLITLTTNSDLATRDYCLYASSDTDGDGWGWENSMSCEVTEDSLSGSESTDTSATIVRNPDVPLCTNANADLDGDGWGWENNHSCQVESAISTTIPAREPLPDCQAPYTDYDGDGWGWGNNGSCIVR